MGFPWKLLTDYVSFTELGKMQRHEYGIKHQTLYHCRDGDIVEIGDDAWIVLTNWAYDRVCRRLSDGVIECKLPTIACSVVGHVTLNLEKELLPC